MRMVGDYRLLAYDRSPLVSLFVTLEASSSNTSHNAVNSALKKSYDNFKRNIVHETGLQYGPRVRKPLASVFIDVGY